jgi:hypothetical protein
MRHRAAFLSCQVKGDTVTVIRDDDEIGRLDLTPEPRILEVLGKIPYQPWQCLAELVDNSFDELLSNQDRDLAKAAAVYIIVPKATSSGADAQVAVLDSGRGMNREGLERALRAGYTGKTGLGTLGLFGMGFNIATARLGNRTQVRTTQAGADHWLVAEIDLREMQRNASFDVPVRREAKPDPSEHGTQIIVRDLNEEMLHTLQRPATMTAVRRRLGRTYSYLLRDASPIPGVPDETLAGCGITLYLNGKRIEPWVPCVWSRSREVSYRGTEISAIEVIDHPLTDAYACVRCGYWQHRLNEGRCLLCDGEGLELRHRQVRGWLGVQRYLHESQFGIDFIRNGRTILMDDKELFTWQDPDTGETSLEYPIEIPRDGRLVGEIHLDHVPVDYQKTDFKRETPEWREAVLHLRGDGPMREKKAKERGYPENRSPLGTLFKAFQKNDPGLRYLIPGDGHHATHETARKWGDLFHKGLPEYQTDERWYEAAARHDEMKVAAGRPSHGNTDPAGSLGGRTGLGPLPLGPLPAGPQPHLEPGGSIPGPAIPVAAGETEDERFDRYRKGSRELYDLAGEVAVSGIGKRQVHVYETATDLANSAGAPVPATSRAGTGMNLEVYVNGEHPVFREYGRDPRDYAIVEIAQVLRAIAHSNTPLLALVADVTSQLPDQRTTPSTLRDRAETVLARIRDLMAPIVASRAAELWSVLPGERKIAAEREAARSSPTLDWREATRDGRFAAYLDCGAIALLVGHDPGVFLDAAVFTANWVGWTDQEARDRQVSQVVRLLDTVGEFLADPWTKNRLGLSMTRLSIDLLDQLVCRSD